MVCRNLWRYFFHPKVTLRTSDWSSWLFMLGSLNLYFFFPWHRDHAFDYVILLLCSQLIHDTTLHYRLAITWSLSKLTCLISVTCGERDGERRKHAIFISLYFLSGVLLLIICPRWSSTFCSIGQALTWQNWTVEGLPVTNEKQDCQEVYGNNFLS